MGGGEGLYCLHFTLYCASSRSDRITLLLLTLRLYLQEQGKQKCHTYWPQEIGPEHKIVFGQVNT